MSKVTSKEKTIKRPARLDIVDMPRDKTRALGGLRQALCASFNYCRKYPAKMTVLKEVLKYTHSRIVAWEKQYKAQQEAEAAIQADVKEAIRLDEVEAELAASVRAKELEAKELANKIEVGKLAADQLATIKSLSVDPTNTDSTVISDDSSDDTKKEVEQVQTVNNNGTNGATDIVTGVATGVVDDKLTNVVTSTTNKATSTTTNIATTTKGTK